MADVEEYGVVLITDDAHVREVCKVGRAAACCRYLVIGGDGFSCVKADPMKLYIDSRVEAGTYGSLGDNCEGWKASG